MVVAVALVVVCVLCLLCLLLSRLLRRYECLPWSPFLRSTSMSLTLRAAFGLLEHGRVVVSTISNISSRDEDSTQRHIGRRDGHFKADAEFFSCLAWFFFGEWPRAQTEHRCYDFCRDGVGGGRLSIWELSVLVVTGMTSSTGLFGACSSAISLWWHWLQAPVNHFHRLQYSTGISSYRDE